MSRNSKTNFQKLQRKSDPRKYFCWKRNYFEQYLKHNICEKSAFLYGIVVQLLSHRVLRAPLEAFANHCEPADLELGGQERLGGKRRE
eukprot:4178561-Amphidinium_carterae.1